MGPDFATPIAMRHERTESYGFNHKLSHLKRRKVPLCFVSFMLSLIVEYFQIIFLLHPSPVGVKINFPCAVIMLISFDVSDFFT